MIWRSLTIGVWVLATVLGLLILSARVGNPMREVAATHSMRV